jgi:ferredoxin
MPKLEIDGKPVEVPAGTRVIQAAKQIGIHIPTMCYMEGLEPFTSCMICMVKDEGKKKLVPGCSALVEEGMRITTEDEEVKRSRKFTLELLFSDHVGDCEAPCHRVCKSHINIPLMIRHIQEDDMKGAVEVLRSAAGLTTLPCHGCEGTCEPGCRRGKAEAPVAIRNLVRYVHDWGAKNSEWVEGENKGRKDDKVFNCAIGKLKEGEIDSFLMEAQVIPRVEPSRGDEAGFTEDEAKLEATRCMHCDCRKANNCSLRDYADRYGVKQREYQPDERNRFRQIRQHGDILFEPEKCIKCGLCIRIAELQKEQLGLTWVGRGFDVQVGTPFNTELSEALTQTAADCVDACPTAALAYRDRAQEKKAIEVRQGKLDFLQPRPFPVKLGWARADQHPITAVRTGGGCGSGGCAH